MGALQRFFNARPTPGAKICVPRMFKSSRLAELAPGVFLPEYAHTIRPRQKLIPNLARILASFESQQFADQSTVDQDDKEHKSLKHPEWYEERLWSSMVSALRMPARARPTGSAPGLTGGQYYGACRTARNVLNGYADQEESIKVSLDDEARASESQEDLEWLPLLDQEEVADGEMLDNATLDEESFDYHSRELAADTNTRVQFEITNQSQMGTISRKPSDAELSTNAECSGRVLTHVLDQESEGVMQDNHTRESCGMIGQHLLIHQADSTDPREGSRLEEMDEDILIVEDLHPTASCLRPKPAIRNCDSKDQEYLFQVNHCPVPSREIEKPFDRERSCEKVDMPTHSPRQSLSEALGGDHLLWKIWKRRGSAAPSEAGDMLEMHNMFEHDPDMKLLKREDRSSYEDPMLFDSFDFSRELIPSSGSSWPGSPADELFEEPLKDPTLHSQSTQSSTRTQNPTSTPKKTKRRSSALQKITPSSRMSDDDILFQQSSPTREVGIKKRKTLLGYQRG